MQAIVSLALSALLLSKASGKMRVAFSLIAIAAHIYRALGFVLRFGSGNTARAKSRSA